MSSDDSKPQLALLTKPPELDLPPRNYWNTAGKNREYFPDFPRPESIPTLNKQGRVVTEPADEWWINSKEHQFCFWTYVREMSQIDGTMEPLLQSEIAKLFGCSSTKVHFMLKEAMERLMSQDNMKILQDLWELSSEEPTSDDTVHGFAPEELEALGDDEDPQ